MRIYWTKNFMAKCKHAYERTCNLFGSEVMTWEIQSGRMDGNCVIKKWFRQSKKIWSKRFATNCQSGVFEERAKLNYVGPDDLREYNDYIATHEELLSQNSFMQRDMNKFREVA